VLLESSRIDEANHLSYLFTEPLKILTARVPEEVPEVFSAVEHAVESGAWVAGYVSYECGAELIGLKSPAEPHSHGPLACFGVYAKACIFDHLTGRFEGEVSPEFSAESESEAFEIRNVKLGISAAEYSARVEAVREQIRAGNTYQVNLTQKLTFEFAGSPMAMYRELVRRQPVPYSAYLHLDGRHVLSISPELFFRIQTARIEGQRITTRPMKGTAPRGRDLHEDAKIARWLQNDEKNRSENIMVVDLLRNDVGRISEFGTVRVDELCRVEKYATLLQMTSSISAKLRPDLSRRDIFASLFPCGSVTGAPKLRTMEIIRELERTPRGIYTGAIGFFSPRGEAVFSVAIRTAVLDGTRGEMGVGGGIVYDSVAAEEYRECELKAKFLTASEPPFQLLETLLWNGEYALLQLHLERLGESAEYFGFHYDHDETRRRLSDLAKSFGEGRRYKVRLLNDVSGAITLESGEVEPSANIEKVAIASARTSSQDRFLRHKTTRRQLYDSIFARAVDMGFDEVLFLNEREEVTEGAISNLFVSQQRKLLTPPLDCGVLPGVYRRHVLETTRGAEERVLKIEDLHRADAVYICNSVRGWRKAEIDFDVVIGD
jgi:para-aminobenzoate synthetase/4-amino-4-deoxychorismate lyase